MERKNGMVWRCSLEGTVLEVVSTDFPNLAPEPAGKSFMEGLSKSSRDLASVWFQKFPASVSLLPNVRFANDPTGQAFTVGLTKVGEEFWMFWSTAQAMLPLPPQLSGTHYQEDEQANTQPHKIWEPDLQHVELLEELSRVNNELVNARRELIRQNIELHRIHRKSSENKPT
ncbi:hypothetical protein GU926_00950 [Nibribacter ruber]|uniref:Uncharacterized protein n=1 Tax=Nibribacter ruber TaxID=2698458 RepID=A0A6P1NVT2_9BACT|nr:hypothetical protein [Nibribacter ruber]QHL86088.1 hypothetical protein GU926_00950 [Nibribacter ruber]